MEKLLKIKILGAFILTLNACATNSGNERIDHSFTLEKGEFDGKAGVERVQILDFLYGNPEGYASRNPPEYKSRGECAQGDGGYVNILRKDLKILYVKWLDKATGKMHEVSLDLAKKLPKDFGENHRVFASFKQGQLYVYIVTPERRPETDAPEGPEAYQWRKNLRIYPE